MYGYALSTFQLPNQNVLLHLLFLLHEYRTLSSEVQHHPSIAFSIRFIYLSICFIDLLQGPREYYRALLCPELAIHSILTHVRSL